MHMEFAEGEHMPPSAENLGDKNLEFTTLEFLESPNRPMPIPDNTRLKVPQ